MFFNFKLIQINTLFKIFHLTFQLSNIEKLLMENKIEKSFLLTKLFSQHHKLFYRPFENEPKYYEEEIYKRKLNIELRLRLLEKSLANNVSNRFLSEIHANYLKNLLQASVKNKQRKKRFVDHETLRNSQIEEILMPKKQITEDDLLMNEFVEEISRKSFEKSPHLFKSLSESLINVPYGRNNKVCHQGFHYTNKCQDVNECSKYEISKNETLNNCDLNAACINTFGSFKCKCNKGFIGDGSLGNCFNGKFCSGRFCRQNGECLYKNSRNGYKCQCMLKCMNGGVCILTKYKYECKCPKNSTGMLCNETVLDNLEKIRFNNQLNKINSIDKLLMHNLINMVAPDLNEKGHTQFKMFQMFERFLNKRSKKREITYLTRS
jgi:hypothetical protein